jgi:acyl-CoA thioesterase I
LGRELIGKTMETRRKQTILSLGMVALILLTTVAMFGSMQSIVDARVIKVACVGDSITQLSGYPFKLQLMLGPNYSVHNFGVAGSTVSLDNKIAYMKQQAFSQALDFQPDIVLIMLGTNDANLESANDTDIAYDYTELLRAFDTVESNPEIVAVDSPPIYSNYSGYNNTYLTTNVIPTIDNVAGQMNIPTINMYSVLNNSEYFADGIHPNNAGSSVIASTMYNAVLQYYVP